MPVNALDKILEEQGLQYEDLDAAERETYRKANFNLKILSIGDVKNYVSYMKDSVALLLADTPWEEELKIVHLQARLKNYVLLEAFLTRPEKAEEAFRKQMDKK